MISSAFGFPTSEYVCRGQKLTSFRNGGCGLAAGSESSQTDIFYVITWNPRRQEHSIEERELGRGDKTDTTVWSQSQYRGWGSVELLK